VQWMGARYSCHHVPIACMHMAMTTLSNSCGILRRRSAQQHAAAASGAVKQHTCVAGQQAVPWRFAAAASKASASRSRPAAASSKPTDGFQPANSFQPADGRHQPSVDDGMHALKIAILAVLQQKQQSRSAPQQPSEASGMRSQDAVGISSPNLSTGFTKLVGRTVGMKNYSRKVCFFDIDAEQSNMI